MRHPSKGPAAALALLMTFAAISAPQALAEDWTVVDTLGGPVEFRVAGPASWQTMPFASDGAVMRSFSHVDGEPLLLRHLIVSALLLKAEDWLGASPGDLPEPSLGTFAAQAAKDLTTAQGGAEIRLISYDVVGLSGLNALRMVVENDIDSPEGRVLELIEYSVVAYERENDGSPVVLSLLCSYIGLAADREATLRRFEAERETIRERFAGSLVILDGPVPATAPPNPLRRPLGVDK
jgi:hypothetical protein